MPGFPATRGDRGPLVHSSALRRQTRLVAVAVVGVVAGPGGVTQSPTARSAATFATVKCTLPETCCDRNLVGHRCEWWLYRFVDPLVLCEGGCVPLAPAPLVVLVPVTLTAHHRLLSAQPSNLGRRKHARGSDVTRTVVVEGVVSAGATIAGTPPPSLRRLCRMSWCRR